MTHEQAQAIPSGTKLYTNDGRFIVLYYDIVSRNFKGTDGKFYKAENVTILPTSSSHYDKETYEPLKIIDHYGLDFYEGNVLKYLLRWRKKDGVKDLEKAQDYLTRLINKQK